MNVDYEAIGTNVMVLPAMLLEAGVGGKESASGFYITFQSVKIGKIVSFLIPPEQARELRDAISGCIAKFPDLFKESP